MDHKSGRRELSEDAIYARYQDAYAKFDSGELRAELIVFQFCGMPCYRFLDELKVGEGLSLRTAKPPLPPPKRVNTGALLNDPEMRASYERIQANMVTGRLHS